VSVYEFEQITRIFCATWKAEVVIDVVDILNIIDIPDIRVIPIAVVVVALLGTFGFSALFD